LALKDVSQPQVNAMFSFRCTRGECLSAASSSVLDQSSITAKPRFRVVLWKSGVVRQLECCDLHVLLWRDPRYTALMSNFRGVRVVPGVAVHYQFACTVVEGCLQLE